MSPLAPPFGRPRSGRRGMVPTLPILGAISDLVAIAGDGQVVLTWTAPVGGVGYQIQYKEAASGTWLDYGVEDVYYSTPPTVAGLSNDVEYDFRVVASDPFTTTTSNEDSATPGSAEASLVVDDFAVSDETQSDELSFDFTQCDDGTGSPAKYAVRIRTPTISDETWGEAFPSEIIVDSDLEIGVTKEVTFVGLAAGTTYQAMLIPFRGGPPAEEFGDFTAPASGTTSGSAALGTIADLTASAGDQQASLLWTPAENATSHQPQYKLASSGTWLNFGSTLGSGASSVVVTGLTNDEEYDFRVQAGDGMSTTDSNEDSATPSAPGALWINEPGGLVTETEFDLTDQVVRVLSDNEDVLGDGDWRHFTSTSPDCEIVAAGSAPSSPPSGRNRVIKITIPKAVADNGGVIPCALRYFFNSSSTRQGYSAVIMMYDGWEYHPNGDKLWFVRQSGGTSNMYIGPSPGGSNLRRDMNWPGGPQGCYNTADQDSNPLSDEQWCLLEWYQSKPASFPNNGNEWLKATPWNGSSWGSTTTLFDVTRPYCTREASWNTMLFTGQRGGVQPASVAGDLVIWVDSMTWRAA